MNYSTKKMVEAMQVLFLRIYDDRSHPSPSREELIKLLAQEDPLFDPYEVDRVHLPQLFRDACVALMKTEYDKIAVRQILDALVSNLN